MERCFNSWRIMLITSVLLSVVALYMVGVSYVNLDFSRSREVPDGLVFGPLLFVAGALTFLRAQALFARARSGKRV